MFPARVALSSRCLAVVILIAPVTEAFAQNRPLSIFGGVGLGTVSGSVSRSDRAVWTVGVGVERLVGSRLAIGAEIVGNQRGAGLDDEDFASGTTLSLTTVSLGPVMR